MEVQFLEVMAGKDVVYEVGQIVDLPKYQAKRFIEHGICILPIEEESFVEVKKAILEPSKVKKRKAKK
jgi:hypothetical protein